MGPYRVKNFKKNYFLYLLGLFSYTYLELQHKESCSIFYLQFFGSYKFIKSLLTKKPNSKFANRLIIMFTRKFTIWFFCEYKIEIRKNPYRLSTLTQSKPSAHFKWKNMNIFKYEVSVCVVDLVLFVFLLCEKHLNISAKSEDFNNKFCW